MYSTCTFCHAPLGKNEALERFPVGRRVAIDQRRGRLWAVCATCGQWNLSPLETRWEAIEEGERLYRDTRLRASTDQIGLARLRDGTELIRIGEPLRPEFAAWRYGERFAQRWRVSGRVGAVVAGGGMILKYAGPFVNVLGSAFVSSVLGVSFTVEMIQRRLTATYTELPDVGRVRLTHTHVRYLRVLRDPSAPGGWALRLPYEPPTSPNRFARPRDPFITISGPRASALAAELMPRINRGGGRRRDVQEAVRALEAHGNPDAIMRLASTFTKAQRELDAAEHGLEPSEVKDKHYDVVALGAAEFARTPAHVRLAVEMAMHEESERRALQGELADLERRWKDAEEIAAIADQLTLPERIVTRIGRIRAL